MMPGAGKAETYRDEAGKWRVRLVAGSGAVVARRGPFETRGQAKAAAESTVREHLAETRRPARRTLTEAQRKAIVAELFADPRLQAVIREYRARLEQQAREMAATEQVNRVVAERVRLTAETTPTTLDGRRVHDRAWWANESRDPASGPGQLMGRVHEQGGVDSSPVRRLADTREAMDTARSENATMTEAERTERRMASWREGGVMYEQAVRPWLR